MQKRVAFRKSQKGLIHSTLLYGTYTIYYFKPKVINNKFSGPLANLFLIQEYSICVPLFIFGFTRNTKSILWRKLQFLLLKTLKQQSTFIELWDVKNKLLSVEVLGLYLIVRLAETIFLERFCNIDKEFFKQKYNLSFSLLMSFLLKSKCNLIYSIP